MSATWDRVVCFTMWIMSVPAWAWFGSVLFAYTWGSVMHGGARQLVLVMHGTTVVLTLGSMIGYVGTYLSTAWVRVFGVSGLLLPGTLWNASWYFGLGQRPHRVLRGSGRNGYLPGYLDGDVDGVLYGEGAWGCMGSASGCKGWVQYREGTKGS